MFDPDICELCGRELKVLGVYRDFVHYRVDSENRQIPCIELSPKMEKLVEEAAKYMVLRMKEGWNV